MNTLRKIVTPYNVASTLSFIGTAGADTAATVLFRRNKGRFYKRPSFWAFLVFIGIAALGGTALKKQREIALLELPEGDHLHLADDGRLMVERDETELQDRVATLEEGL